MAATRLAWRLFLIAATAAGASVGTVHGQTYRPEQPAVMTPPPPKPSKSKLAEAETFAKFSALYEQKGRPKMVLFWNKELSDQLSDFVTVARISEYKQHSSTHTETSQTGAKGNSGSKEQKNAEFNRTDTNLDVRMTDGHRPALSPLANQRMQGAFSSAFRDVKVNFLDRALLMRLTENQQRADNVVDQTVDSRATEIAAVAKHADIVVQIGMVRDPSTRAGMAYQVQVSDLKTGAIYAQFVARDEGGAPDKTRWQAGTGGYEQVVIPGYTNFSESGRALAVKTMGELLKSW